MSRLTAFGLFAVTAMLVTYALEKRHHGFILGFAFACLLGSAYGFLQGAWPFGLVEGVWQCRRPKVVDDPETFRVAPDTGRQRRFPVRNGPLGHPYPRPYLRWFPA